MGKLVGSIVDSDTGERIEAKVQVLDSSGASARPKGALLKVGPGLSFFYSDGGFEVDVTRGLARITVERGTEYVPTEVTVDAPSRGTEPVTIRLRRWGDLAQRGWHPGNTHIHYDEKETNPDERLRLDPRVEDLRMTAVSILKRGELEYATNKYPIGMLTDFCSAHHYVECGEESRNNSEPWTIGYGHIMLLNIRNAVEPVSTGVLVDAFAPDYPPLCYACDDAHRQGGIVIWCHNGQGMEAPVAAALGKLDAFNLFDPWWNDTEYDIYYRMLNAGLRLPASTGSDWFISSANRVYGYTGGLFEYDTWLQALKAGRTFITNGPALFLSVDGESPGAEVEVESTKPLHASLNWLSHYPVNNVEVLLNGRVAAAEHFPAGSTSGALECEIPAINDGWIAARVSSTHRDSYFQPIFAHSSPIYIRAGSDGPEKREAALWFDKAIEDSIEWVRTRGRYYTDAQRNEVLDLFRQGQQAYKEMVK
jgi:hypothetical protein